MKVFIKLTALAAAALFIAGCAQQRYSAESPTREAPPPRYKYEEPKAEPKADAELTRIMKARSR